MDEKTEAEIGVVEPGYVGASRERQATHLRLPWGERPKHTYPRPTPEPSVAAKMVAATLAARAVFVAIIDFWKGTAR
jgi:hypothetical protein